MKCAFFIASVALMLFPLIGAAEVPTKEIDRAKILSKGPEWQARYDEFKPNADMIKEIKAKIGDDLRIDVYLGLWCSDSRNHVPVFIKILDEMGTPVTVRYIDVYRKPSKVIRYFVDSVQVERVPTFIFYRNDKEVGRIIENPKVGIPEDMLEILSK